MIFFKNSVIAHGFKKVNVKIFYFLQQKSCTLLLIHYPDKLTRVATGSPIGTSLANTFLAYHEQNWLVRCPLEYRYIHDIYVIFRSFENLKRFRSYLDLCDVNISVFIKTEQNNKISFLDVHGIQEQGKFTRSVYRKPFLVTHTAILIAFYPISTNLVWFTG